MDNYSRIWALRRYETFCDFQNLACIIRCVHGCQKDGSSWSHLCTYLNIHETRVSDSIDRNDRVPNSCIPHIVYASEELALIGSPGPTVCGRAFGALLDSETLLVSEDPE